jgi:hypothetical protein
MKRLLFAALAILTVWLMAAGCASTGEVIANEAEPGPGESVVLVKRIKDRTVMSLTMKVFIDNELKASLKNGQETRIIISNGDHTIRPEVSGVINYTIPFTVNSQEISFSAEAKRTDKGGIAFIIDLKQTGKKDL